MSSLTTQHQKSLWFQGTLSYSCGLVELHDRFNMSAVLEAPGSAFDHRSPTRRSFSLRSTARQQQWQTHGKASFRYFKSVALDPAGLPSCECCTRRPLSSFTCYSRASQSTGMSLCIALEARTRCSSVYENLIIRVGTFPPSLLASPPAWARALALDP